MVGLALLLAGATLLVSQVPARPKVSLTFVEYRGLQNAAVLRLTNGTGHTIRYLAEPTHGGPVLRSQKTSSNGTRPTSWYLAEETHLGPVLCSQETFSGSWSNSSPAIRTLPVYNQTTRTVTEGEYWFFDVSASPKPLDYRRVLQNEELSPGQSVDFFVLLEPGALPKRVGTLWSVAQSGFMKQVHTLMWRVKQLCGVRIVPPGQREVWCPDALCLSSSRWETPGRWNNANFAAQQILDSTNYGTNSSTWTKEQDREPNTRSALASPGRELPIQR